MDIIMSYVKPELICVSIALYFLGTWIKKSEYILDKYIPLALGAVGILICALWVTASSSLNTWQEIVMAIFTSVVQGIIVAALSNYVNQLIKQNGKSE